MHAESLETKTEAPLSLPLIALKDADEIKGTSTKL